MSTLKQQPLLPHVKIKLEKEAVNARNITNHDWKLNPNVQVKIILHKLDFSKRDANTGKDSLPRELSKNPQDSLKLNYENVAPKPTPVSLEKDNNSKQFLDDLQDIVLQCEAGCSICCKFVNQLSLHVRDSHIIHDSPLENENTQTQDTSLEMPSEMFVNFNLKPESNDDLDVDNSSPPLFEPLTFHAAPDETPTTNSSYDELVPLPPPLPDVPPDTKQWKEMFHISNNIKNEPIDNISINMEDPLYNAYECYDSSGETTGNGYTNNTNFNMEEESLAQHNIDMNQSEHCNEGFISQAPSIRQARPQPYYCEKCNLNFSDITFLIDHNTRVHDHTWTMDNNMDNHPRPSVREKLRAHLHEKLYNCEICNICFKTAVKLNRHKLTVHTSGKETIFQHLCATCGKSFSAPDGLRKHLRLHTGERPFKCHSCNKDYRQKSDLNRHLRSNNHKGLNNIPVATETSKILSVPSEHVHVSVAPNPHPQFEQQLPGNADDEVQLLPTQGTIITNRHSCKFCGVKFFTEFELEQHVRQFHFAVY